MHAALVLIFPYTDTAIRRAQRHQLDLGQNPSQGLTDEEYQEWRQLWLTVISFDRYVYLDSSNQQVCLNWSLIIHVFQ
jgi:hypothetical protein